MEKYCLLVFVWLCLGIGVGKAQYTVLHAFNDTDGGAPRGSLILSGKTLYGMTYSGGVNNDGNIFSIDTDGSNYQVLQTFNGTNGQFPCGALTLSGNELYGNI